MSKPKYAFLINTETKEVTEIPLPKSLDEIYSVLKCSIIEAVNLENGDAIYIDEEGLLKENTLGYFQAFGPASQPLAGYGLVVGIDYKGDEQSPESSIWQIRGRVRFHGPDQISKPEPFMEVVFGNTQEELEDSLKKAREKLRMATIRIVPKKE